MSRFSTAFLDRDGTISVKPPEGQYITAPDQIVLLPGAGEAVRRLNDAGVRVVLVSNQRCVALGLVSMRQVAAINDRLRQLLAQHGAGLDAVYVCPHEDGVCDCRKPLPGLLLQAAADHPETELAHSVLVGDAESDVLAGLAVGCIAVRLAPAGTLSGAQLVVASLSDAVARILDAGWQPTFDSLTQ
jgi:D-glycero-D-manno-heptose 1,7-bisphosphate phosphatase